NTYFVRVAVERQDPSRDLFLDEPDVVDVGDVEVLPQDVDAGSIAGTAAVGRAAAIERQRIPAQNDAQEFVDESRLADAGFTHDDRDATLTAKRDVVEDLQQLRELGLSPEERRHRTYRRAVEARPWRRRAADLGDFDGPLDPLD